MIQVSDDALREGCERAHDLFMLNRLRDAQDAAAGFDAAYRAHGIDPEMRAALEHSLAEILPVEGAPMLEAAALASMLAGVMVGLMIADSTLPAEELDLPVVPAP